MQLRPHEYLPIVRQLADPLDTTTYYVRAYIYKCRGADAPALLATLDMVDRGNQRFTYQYEIPADAGGEGYFLSIITRIFTDSGYTTESEMYARTEERFLVAERWNLALGRGGGVDVNYKKVRRIIKEEIGKSPKIKPIKPISLAPLLNALKKVNDNIEAIRIPEPEKIDFTSVIKAVEKVQAEVGNIKIPEQEKLNLSPILDLLRKIESQRVGNWLAFDKSYKKFVEHLKSFTGRLEKGFLIKMPGGEGKPKKHRIII